MYLLLLLVAVQATSALPAHGRVDTVHLHSTALGVDKSVLVYLPPSYDTSGRSYPSLYYLHGGGGNERTWLDRFHIGLVVDSLIATGLPEAILVLPDGDTGYWTDWVNPTGFANRCATDSMLIALQEQAATWCVKYGRYETYVASEVVPVVDHHYRTARDRDQRGIAGVSMGGYGAFFLALRHPDLWAAAVSHSGVLQPLYIGPHPFKHPPMYASNVDEILAAWDGNRRPLFIAEFGSDTATWWARDPLRQLMRLLRQHQRLPLLYFDVGTSDRFADQSRAFADTLRRLGIEYRFAEWPGGHDWTYWGAHAPAGLVWLLTQVASSKVGAH